MVSRTQRDNALVTRLAAEDENDRLTNDFQINPQRVWQRDAVRRQKVLNQHRRGKLKTARDYYHAAYIFQHGNCLAHIKRAHTFAAEALQRGGCDGARWLFAASWDRQLVLAGYKQKFGTQYRLVTRGKHSRMQLFPVDRRTSDKLRLAYEVPALAVLVKRELEMTDRYCRETNNAEKRPVRKQC
jgi:hypothetical protein